RHVPLNVWFRFRRAVEDTPAILVVLEQESNAKTCASLVLQLAAERAQWLSTLAAAQAVDDPLPHPPSCLLDSFELRAGILRSRVNVVSAGLRTGTSNEAFPSEAAVFNLRNRSGPGKHLESFSSTDRDAIFITRSIWSFK
ncbi:MAG TPA: hypothetical protein VH161_01195, partial [Candidatus Acidoferrales bacterium]|nr:hypothetical protein [Candidatus Acidoferrales bacterium]